MRSVMQDASLALFDSLRTSQKSDSSAKTKFASISLPLGISIAVGRGRAVSAGQRNWGRCCTLQPHYSFATGFSLHSAELGVACVLKQGVGGLQPQRAQSARRRAAAVFARRRRAAAAVS